MQNIQDFDIIYTEENYDDNINNVVFNTDADEKFNQIIENNTSKNLRELNDFLKNMTVTKGMQHNVVNITGGSYFVPDEQMPQFFEKMEACRLAGVIMHLAEAQKNPSGICLDFDYKQTQSTREYSKGQIDKLISAITEILFDIIDWTHRGRKIHAVVTQKVSPVASGDKYKDGFHIYFPDVWVMRNVKVYLIEEILKREIITTIFRKYENPNSMLDKQSSSFNAVYFGSCKGGSKPYIYAYSYEIIIDPTSDSTATLFENIDEVKYNGRNRIQEFSLSSKGVMFDKQDTTIRPHIMQNLQPDPEKSLVVDEIDEKCQKDDEFKYLKLTLDILPAMYYDDYNAWLKVIFALKTEGDTYKCLAHYFSKKSRKYDANSVDSLWTAVPTDGKQKLSRVSIFHWATINNPAEFNKLKNENIVSIILKMAFTQGNNGHIRHADVAVLLELKFRGKYATVCLPSDKKRKWYQYVDSSVNDKEIHEMFKWREIEQPLDIDRFISSDNGLGRYYSKALGHIDKQLESAKDANQNKMFLSIKGNLSKSKSDLKDSPTKNNIIKELGKLLNSNKFLDVLDSDPFILGVGNGILKLMPEPVLIQGPNELYVCRHITNRYKPYDPEDPIIKRVEQSYRDIYTEPDVYEYMMMAFSTALNRGDPQNLLILLTGGGRNGKTSSLERVADALSHDFIGKLTMSLFSDIKTPGAEKANPALHVIKDKTLCFSDESAKDQELNTQTLKTLTGASISNRTLHKEQEIIKNHSMYILCSNFKFRVSTTDHGTWRRIRCYDVKTRFVDSPSGNNKFEKKNDYKMAAEYSKDPQWQEALISILVYWHTILYTKYGGKLESVPCPTIERETEEFRNKNDFVNSFLCQMLVRSENDVPEILLTDLAQAFNEWANSTLGRTPHSISELQDLFENSVKIMDNIVNHGNYKTLRKHRLKASVDDEIREGEVELNLKRR